MKDSFYTVTFDDGSQFIGGTIHESKWNDMPDKLVRQIKYSFGNKEFILKGFEAYNQLIERGHILNGKHKKTIITSIMIMGKVNQKVYLILFDFMSKKTSKLIVSFGEEYRGTSSTGWKKGKFSSPEIIEI